MRETARCMNGNDYVTLYIVDDFNIVEFLEHLRSIDSRYFQIFVDENVEQDMATVSGAYSLESLIQNIDYIYQNAYDKDSILFYADIPDEKGRVSVLFNTIGNVKVFSNFPDYDLNEIINYRSKVK